MTCRSTDFLIVFLSLLYRKKRKWEEMKFRKNRTVLVVILAVVALLMFTACGTSKAAIDGLMDLSNSAGSKDTSDSAAKKDSSDSSMSKGSSDSQDANDLAEKLIGNWSEVDIDNTYTFNSNGTGSETFEGTSWDMTWSLDGDMLTMDFPETGVEEYRISIKGDRLTVHNPVIKYEYIRR